MLTLRVELFGTPRLFDGDRQLVFSAPPKTMPLLAYLLLRRGERLPREKIAFALWPDDSEDGARSNLRRHLYHLQRLLPHAQAEPWIEVKASTLRWNAEPPLLVDVLEFLRYSGGTPTQLEDASSLYTGDFLDGYYDDWIVAERERLREIHVENLLRLIVVKRGERALAEALEMAAEVFRLDPWRESALRNIMEVRLESGDRAGAFSAYEQFAQRLLTELDAEPMSETTALYEAIRRNSAVATGVQRPSNSDIKPERGPMLPFVGRQATMQRLSDFWKAAASGSGRTVLLTGEAGAGKSRVAREFSLRAQADGARILWGATPAFEPRPYHAVLAALRHALPMLSEASLEPQWTSALAVVLPEIRSYLRNVGIAEPLATESESARLFEAVTRAFEILAQPRPLVLVLEDLHYAGSGTIALSEYIFRRLAATQALCIVTYGDENIRGDHTLRAFRRRIAADGVGESLVLAALKESDVAELCGMLCVGNDNAIAKRFFSESEGNAYFLSEAVYNWQEQPATQGERAPATAIVETRLARLSEAARSVAEIAVIIGRGFNLELLQEICQWPEAELLDAIDELLDRRMIRESASRGHGDYVFSHQLTRATIYASLDQSTKRRRHRRAARAILQLYPDSLKDYAAELAHHFELGDEPAQAARYYLQAALHARDIFANHEALGFADCGGKLATEDGLRFELCALREELLRRLGRREEQGLELKRLSHLAQIMGDPLNACETLYRQCLYHREGGDLQRYTTLCAELEQLATSALSPRFQALAAYERALLAMRQGDLKAANAAAILTEEFYAQVSDAGGIARAVALQADVAISAANLEAADRLLIKARSLSQRTEGAEALVSILTLEERLAFFRRDFQASLHFGTELLALAAKVGDRETEASAHNRLGTSNVRFFHYEEASEHYALSSDIFESLGNARGGAIALFNRGVFQFNIGRIDDALASSQTAKALFERIADARGIILVEINLSVANLFSGKVQEAVEHALRALKISQGKAFGDLTAFALTSLGAAYREAGDLKKAIEHLEAGLVQRRKLTKTTDLLADLSDLALTYLMAGRREDAHRIAREFISYLEPTSEQLSNFHIVLWQIARVLHAVGERELSDQTLGRIRKLLELWRSRVNPEIECTFTAVCARTGLLDALERDEFPKDTAPLFSAA